MNCHIEKRLKSLVEPLTELQWSHAAPELLMLSSEVILLISEPCTARLRLCWRGLVRTFEANAFSSAAWLEVARPTVRSKVTLL